MNTNSDKKLERLITACAKKYYKEIPGVGVVANFDALSDNTQCKKLAIEGSRYAKTELVRRFCNSFPKDAIPERCKCYRFPDTPDYKRYSSIWQEMVDESRGASPFVSSYTCFYEKCGKNVDAYKTPQMEEVVCPTTVFCKQQVGSINVKGDTLADIQQKLVQKCGIQQNNRKDEGPKENDSDNVMLFIGIGVVIISVLLLFIIAASV